MTTVVVVRKGTQVALASDSLVTFGDTRLAHGYEENEKLFRVGDSWVGMAGTTAHFPVLRRVLHSLPPDELKLRSRDEVFEFDRFWAIGSGRAFALGAMYGVYGGKMTAREIAELGVRAGCEFDKNSAGPIKAHTIKLKAKD